MILLSLTVLAVWVTWLPVISAYAHMSQHVSVRQASSDPHAWIPASQIPASVRSPCPGTNTLANHGFINRDGKNVTVQAYQQAFLDAFQMAFVSTKAGATNAINLCKKLTGKACKSFDLDMLNTPHAIEHDASLSREDDEMWYGPANNSKFNQTVWDMTLAVFGNNTHVNIPLANTARVSRIQQAMDQDAPGWFIRNDQTSGTEAAFYLYTMNDLTIANWSFPQARLDWINHWIVNEELPTALGWTKPSAFPVAANGKGYILSIKDRVLAAKTIQTSTSSAMLTSSSSAIITETVTTPDLDSPTATDTLLASSADQPSNPTSTSTPPSRAIDVQTSNERPNSPLFAASDHEVLLNAVPDFAHISPLGAQPDRSAVATSLAKAVATAEASPAPQLPDTYHQIVSPQKFAALEPAVKKHEREVEKYYRKALGVLLEPPA